MDRCLFVRLQEARLLGGLTVVDKITESLLQEFSVEHGITLLEQSKQFEHFASYLIVRGEHSESFDTQDLVVGDDKQSSEGTDTGIDGIAVVVNGILISDVEELEEQLSTAGYLETTFVFVQAETTSGFDGAKIGTFGFGVSDFFRDVPKLKRNAKISGFVEIAQAIYSRGSKFRRGNPICKLFYVTTGKWTGDGTLQARIDGVKSDLMDTGLFREVQFTPVGAEGVQKMYQRSRYAISAEFTFANRTTIPEVPQVAEAHFGYLPWGEFKKLIIDDSDKLVDGLFFDNVRDWQGYNDVNSEIKGTLTSSDRGRFVLMNNGVTVIARTLQTTGHKFTIEDYQIVNGCQTTHVLFTNEAASMILYRFRSGSSAQRTKMLQTQLSRPRIGRLRSRKNNFSHFSNSPKIWRHTLGRFRRCTVYILSGDHGSMTACLSRRPESLLSTA